LAKYTAEAFGLTLEPDANRFLLRFKATGTYLEDLCPVPINHLPRAQRTAHRQTHVKGLAHKLRTLQPLAIAVVMKAIAPYVARSIQAAELVDLPVRYLPFPAQGHQQEYVTQLRQYLMKLRKDGVVQGVG
jgi:hypothetical protein